MNETLVYEIASAVLALATIFSAIKYRQGKRLLKDISDVLEDDEITVEETTIIIAGLLGIVEKTK